MEEAFAETSLKILVILIAAKVSGELFRRLGQSPVLGELLAGIALGPAVFNLLHPGENSVISYLALLGIAILLFEVGIETNLAKLRKDFPRSFLVGAIGVSLPFLLGYLAIFAWFNDQLLALFIGATMTATSVGITARVLADLKKLDTSEGRIILGAAVIDDIAGLVFLSVLLGLAEGSGISFIEAGKIIVLAVLFVALAIFIGVKLAPTLMKLVKKMGTRGSLEVSAFVICVGVAYLAAEIGLALIIGAFIAGLMLESVEEKAHILPRMQFMSDTFVPIFFVSAGAMLNPRTISSPESVLLLLLLFIIAFTGKALSGFGAWNNSIKSRLTIGAGMTPRGEVGLIFASAGFMAGVFDERFYSIVVGMIMLTTFVTPLILKPLLSKNEP